MFKRIVNRNKPTDGRDVGIITGTLKYYNQYYKESSGIGIQNVKTGVELEEKKKKEWTLFLKQQPNGNANVMCLSVCVYIIYIYIRKKKFTQ